MADPIQPQVTTVAFKSVGSGGNSVFQEMTNLGAQRYCQLEAPGYEMARSGRSFCGGIQAVTNGTIPLVDLPTTTAKHILYNAANPANNPPRHLVIKRLSFSYASGTLGAFGSSVFAGVSPSAVTGNCILTANGTGFSIGATRGTGASVAFMDTAKTGFPSGAALALFGGIAHGAETTMSIGYTVDISNSPLIVPPGFGLNFGVLADTGTTAKYLMSVFWDEVEAVLP
jgi:hypothetical protein